MTGRCWRRGLQIGVLLLLAAPMALGSIEAGENAGGGEEGLTVPYPDLTAMQPASRRKVEIVQKRLEDLLADPASDRGQLVDSFGFLGQMLHAFERLDAAAQSYEAARRLAPGDHRWPYYLGLIHISNGELEVAAGHFREARRLAPDDQTSALRLADVLLELGNLSEAEIYYERLRTDDAMRAAALWGLGRIADLRGDRAAAVGLFEQVLELQPAAGSVHYALGQAYRALGNSGKAQYHLDRVDQGKVGFADPQAAALNAIAKSSALGVVADLAAADTDFSERDYLGFVLSQVGEMQGSVALMESMLDQLKASGQATDLQIARLEYAIGALLVSEGRDAESVDWFRRSTAGDPGLVDARAKLGNVLARLGRLPEALEAFDQGLELEPENVQLLGKRAAALANLDRLAEARAAAEKAIDLEPEAPAGWRLLAGLREREGDLEGAVVAFERAAALSGQPAEVMERYTELGDLHRRWKQPGPAARAYLEALRIDQRFVPALARLAAVMGELGTFDRAAEVYGKWSAVEPANPEPRVGEATSLILDGQHKAARDRLVAALEAIPDNLDIKDILARHLAACPDRSVRDGAQALELAREVWEAVPSAESIETMAMAYAESGDFVRAIEWQQRLLAAVSEETAAADVGRWRANLELYERGAPCCAASVGD